MTTKGQAELLAELSMLLNQTEAKLTELAQAWGAPPEAFTPVAPHHGHNCDSCGMSDRRCWEQIRGFCCSTCHRTATHGQDEPGYVPPWEDLP